MEILAETGCYVDMTYPTSAFHPAQISRLNSMYECAWPLHERAPHRHGRELKSGAGPRFCRSSSRDRGRWISIGARETVLAALKMAL
jgi:hypothetical protein